MHGTWLGGREEFQKQAGCRRMLVIALIEIRDERR